jgi:hypothetical protein
MIIRRYRMLHVLALTVVTIYGSAARSTAQVTPELLELRAQLVEARNDDYIAVRDEAMALPKESFDDLLFLLRLTPEYSLERTLALILEARAAHPEEAARFDRELRHMVENPTLWVSRSGQPLYHVWASREVNEVHPLVYEAVLKLDLPALARIDVFSLARSPNPENIPLILHYAKHHGIGALSWLPTATEGFPEEREWLRPLTLRMYKEDREKRNVAGAYAVVGVFRRFGTHEDLDVLKHLREYERELMPQQGFTLDDRRTLYLPLEESRRMYTSARTDMERAEREGAPAHVLEQLQQRLVELEAHVLERQRQFDAKLLVDHLDRAIERLEARLKQGDDGS